MKRTYLATLIVASITVATMGQAPRTISHQGILTEPGGAPAADAARTMVFSIYDVASSGSALWSESKSVSTSNGVFHTMLGSVTPITGIDFDQPLWLGIKVAADDEMSPRTTLTSVPSAFSLVMPLIDTLEIETADLGTDGSEGVNEDLVIRSGDAQIGLYSNNGGSIGSGFQLGEIVGGALANKWSIYRHTTGGDGSLHFTYGSDPAYSANPTKIRIDTTGSFSAETTSLANSARAIRGTILSTSPGLSSTAVQGVNKSNTSSGIGVSGSHEGSGIGVLGGVIGAGTGVFGASLSPGGQAAQFQGYEGGGTFDPDIKLVGLGRITADSAIVFSSLYNYDVRIQNLRAFRVIGGPGFPNPGLVGFEVSGEGDAVFSGDLDVVGTLTKGSGTFRIDHPLEPSTKYLSHSFVESPDMMNVYNGNVVTDVNGQSTVELPSYFEALNRDFRYQLTVIGSFARVMVDQKVEGNRFSIRTDAPNVEVSWQVTGVRKDAYAERNRVVVETEKSVEDQGRYLHPEAFGVSPERRIGHDVPG